MKKNFLSLSATVFLLCIFLPFRGVTAYYFCNTGDGYCSDAKMYKNSCNPDCQCDAKGLCEGSGERCCGGGYVSGSDNQNNSQGGNSDVYDSNSYCAGIDQYIPDGATIRAEGDIDVYIVKYSQNGSFKRLILSPSVFENYGHLRWEDVRDVGPEILNCFGDSGLVRSAESGNIYMLHPEADYGVKQFVSPEVFAKYGFDLDAVYEINAYDEKSYVAGTDLI